MGKSKSLEVLEIDTDLTPKPPFNGAQIEYHKKTGKIILDFSKLYFYLSDKQKNDSSVGGHKLRKELKGKNVMNAWVLDFLLANPHLIPESWKKDENGKTRFIYFWGTIFRDSYGDLYVSCLYFHGGIWQTDYDYLDNGWNGCNPALLSVKQGLIT